MFIKVSLSFSSYVTNCQEPCSSYCSVCNIHFCLCKPSSNGMRHVLLAHSSSYVSLTPLASFSSIEVKESNSEVPFLLL